ncbi:type VI secretion system-associated protein TagF [Acinetobacter variabilis]|uniref:type VI secretion system-associated protein TagF n=1 Tax=Acinetobacter variabilis TaxID=70346 RepID=UPI0028A1A5BF|nr:type VI secretion system-associated protein TagF [Acinetobacter variabilis]
MYKLSTQPFYYGKCPAHGDFLKSQGQHGLIQSIDRWISKALEYAMQSNNFKQYYIKLPSLDFFLVNLQVGQFLVANLISSEDYSGRHFPMVLGQVIETDQPHENLMYLHYRFKPMLIELYQRNLVIRSIQSPDILLNKLSKLSDQSSVYSAEDVQHFYDTQTLNSLARLMGGTVYELVQTLIALGLLLQPIIQQGTDRLNKILILPIHNVPYCYEIAAFWINLISLFIQKQSSHLFIGLLHADQPVLLCGFQGTDSIALGDIFNQNMQSQHWVSLVHAAWIDPYLEQNAGLAVLEQILNQQRMSLTNIIQIFKQTFIEE